MRIHLSRFPPLDRVACRHTKILFKYCHSDASIFQILRPCHRPSSPSKDLHLNDLGSLCHLLFRLHTIPCIGFHLATFEFQSRLSYLHYSRILHRSAHPQVSMPFLKNAPVFGIEANCILLLLADLGPFYTHPMP